MNIFKIVHPNGCLAHVRALHEHIAIEMLINEFNDQDWQFGQASVIRQEPGSAEILLVGKPLIPTKNPLTQKKPVKAQ
jgi:hypothetical protein